MTESTDQSNRPTPQPTSPRGAGRRHLVALNVIVGTVLVVGLVGAANYVAGWLDARYDLTADLTAGGRFTFSERSKLVLKRLDGPVRMTSLFVAAEGDETEELRKRRVEELLREYERRSADVEVDIIDPAEDAEKLADLGRRIAGQYADEVQPYIQAIKDYRRLQARLTELLRDEKQRFEQLAAAGGLSPTVASYVSQVNQAIDGELAALERLDKMLTDNFADVLDVPAAERSEPVAGSLGVPPYTDARNQITAELNAASNLLSRIANYGEGVIRAEGMKLSEASRELFAGAQQRYQLIQQDMLAMVEQLGKLEPLELESRLSEISLNSVIIEVAGKIRVIDFDTLWPVAPGQDAYNPAADRAFVGEDAVTAALVTMTMADPPVALFVTWGGQAVNRNHREFQEVVTRLEQSGFTVANWDLQAGGAMPQAATQADRVVLVLMLPAQQQNPRMPMMPPSPEAYAPVHRFLAEGGAAMVFTQVRIGPMTPPLPYAAMVDELFGIRVRQDAATLRGLERADGEMMVIPEIDLTTYADEAAAADAWPIIRPLTAMGVHFLAPCPLLIADELPDAARVWPLILVPDDRNYWGETNVMMMLERQTPRFQADEDVAPPYPVAVAAERPADAIVDAPASTDAAEAEPAARSGDVARVVVFGDAAFATARYAGPNWFMTEAGSLAFDYPYPANAELVTNAMLWLAGMDEMIATSPQVQQAQRITAEDPDAIELVRWLLWIGLPLAVALVGVAVFFLRRQVR